MEQNANFAYTLKQTFQFKKDLKSVKFDDNKLNELQIIFEHLGRLGSHSKLFDKQRKLK